MFNKLINAVAGWILSISSIAGIVGIQQVPPPPSIEQIQAAQKNSNMVRAAAALATPTPTPNPVAEADFKKLVQDAEKKRQEMNRKILSATPSPGIKLGEKFEVEGIAYIVDSAKDLGNDLSKTTESRFSSGKSDGGKFIVVYYEVTNNGLNETPLKISVHLTDSMGRNYKPVEFLSGYSFSPSGRESLSDNEWRPTTVKPGFSKKLYSLVEVASDSAGLSFFLIGQNGRARIKLPF